MGGLTDKSVHLPHYKRKDTETGRRPRATGGCGQGPGARTRHARSSRVTSFSETSVWGRVVRISLLQLFKGSKHGGEGGETPSGTWGVAGPEPSQDLSHTASSRKVWKGLGRKAKAVISL